MTIYKSYLSACDSFLLTIDQGSHHCSSPGFCSKHFCFEALIRNPAEVGEEVPPVDLKNTPHEVLHNDLVDFVPRYNLPKLFYVDRTHVLTQSLNKRRPIVSSCSPSITTTKEELTLNAD